MAWRPQLNVVCGRCGKPSGNPLTHVCINPRGKKGLQLRPSFGRCPDCKRPYGANPLAHVCAPKSDFRRRKAAHDKERAKAKRKRPQQPQHDYTLCSDNQCPRPLCVAYKTGWREGDREGYDRGWRQGYDAGYQAGYDSGYPDGINACPKPHK